MYGPPEAGLRWHKWLTKTLVRYGFQHCLTDAYLFVKPDQRTYIILYVDDVVIAGPLPDVMWVKEQLVGPFMIKDLGVAYLLPVCLVHRDECGIRLTQEQHPKALLQKYGCLGVHGKRTPFNEAAKRNTAALRCSSAEKHKINLKDAVAECTCAPFDEPA